VALRVKSVRSHLYEIFKVAPVVYPTVTLSMIGLALLGRWVAHGHDRRALTRLRADLGKPAFRGTERQAPLQSKSSETDPDALRFLKTAIAWADERL
jgi:hypothetical protein